MSIVYEKHPLCTLFPRMNAVEFTALVADIKANGLNNPIVTCEGMILDGGNRYEACLEAGVVPEFKEFEGENIVAFVLSSNLHRRHLSAGQSAAIVASAVDWGNAAKVGNPQFTINSTLQKTKDRAQESGASKATQQKADAVVKANPVLGAQVARGEVSLNEATKQVAPQLLNQKPAPHNQLTDEELAAVNDDVDMLADYQAQIKENENLRAQLKSLTATDKDAELLALTQRVINAESQTALMMNQAAADKRRLKEYGSIMAKLREMAGTDDDRKVVALLRKQQEVA